MKTAFSLLYIVNVSLRKAGSLLPVVLLLFTSQARALECGFSNTFTENVSIPVIGIGISTVGEDVPVGKVLYHQEYQTLNKATNYYCTITEDDLENGVLPNTTSIYSRTDVTSTPSGAASRIGGKDVFPTNVPGIGVIFYISGMEPNYTAFPYLWQQNMPIYYGTSSMAMGMYSRTTIELVKTGPIQQGTQQVQGASFPTFQITAGSNSPFVIRNTFFNLNFVGSTTVHTKTCQLVTPELRVELGEYPVSDFDNPGKATEWENFDIVLEGCPPFYGYGNYKFSEITGKLTGSNSDNIISIAFKSVNGTVEGNPLLAKLDGGENAATGVGIELSQQGISGSIPMDGSGGFSLQNLSQEENANYKIPLKARYVQTDNTVTAGPANGSVIFTITYL